jgi:SAM-dependent methyltransferase
MPTLDWLRKEFNYGYDSGDVLSLIPNITRFNEERRIGGSYRKVFFKAVLPYIQPNSVILELGPGKGSWSRAILKYIPQGELHTVDFQDVKGWLKPEKYNGRLICHQVKENSFSGFKESYFDFFWSFGVLCHNNAENIREILHNSLQKVKKGGVAVHQYGDWEKLDIYGWEKGKVPIDFKKKSDNEIWWPRNNQEIMRAIAVESGWSVISSDLGLLKRDSIIFMKRI